MTDASEISLQLRMSSEATRKRAMDVLRRKGYNPGTPKRTMGNAPGLIVRGLASLQEHDDLQRAVKQIDPGCSPLQPRRTFV